MKFEYLKVYKNGDKSIGHLEAQTDEAAKLMIKKLAPCTGTIRAVYDIDRVRNHEYTGEYESEGKYADVACPPLLTKKGTLFRRNEVQEGE